MGQTMIMNFLSIASCLLCITGIYARLTPPIITEPQTNRWSSSVRTVRNPITQSIKCEAKNANPTAKYYWTFNGTDIQPNPLTVSYDRTTGTLTVGKDFGTANNGDYQCFAYNDLGKSMTPILKIYRGVHNGFSGDKSIEPVSRPENTYVKLECKYVKESVPPWTYSWTRGATRSEDEAKLFVPFELEKDRMMIDPDGSLHFFWLKKSDEYHYSCETTNDLYLSTYRNPVVMKLEVTDGSSAERTPSFQYSTEDAVVYVGHTTELMCIFSYYTDSKTKAMKIKWLHNGNDMRIDSANNTLRDVKISSEGDYRCEAWFDNKKAADHTIKVKVVSAPTFIPGEELTKTEVPVEKDAVFHCGTTSHKAYSYPTVWLVNAVPLLGCPERMFECTEPLETGYSRCISEKMQCDNTADCPDRSDELNCPVSCAESQKLCNGLCIAKTSSCNEAPCDWPRFLCHDKLTCISENLNCTNNADCPDGSDELACPNRPDIKRGRFYINSQRSQLTLPAVAMSDNMCVQCIARNQWGTTIGDACLKVIDKITVLREPDGPYNVEPGSRIEVMVDAKTDPYYNNDMKFTWLWYREKMNATTGETYLAPEKLPPSGKVFTRYFSLTNNNKTMVMTFPEVKEGDENEQEELDIYNMLINRRYYVKISHAYDEVNLNFTVSGKEILPPPGPIIETASTNLWFIALILGILLLFIVIALIVCYMYRNRGGTYPLDKKEHQAGHDPALELKNSGFQDVGRIGDEEDSPQGDRVSLTESVKPIESDDDVTEEYGGDFDVSKFNEEGSFIGLYGAKTKEATV